MKNLFAGRAMQMRIAVHQKIRFTWQMRNVAFGWGNRAGSKISPSILLSGTSNFTAESERRRCVRRWAKCPFFGNEPPPTERLNRFRNISSASQPPCNVAAWCDFRCQPIQRMSRDNIQSWSKIGWENWECNLVTSDGTRTRLIDRLQHRLERIIYFMAYKRRIFFILVTIKHDRLS